MRKGLEDITPAGAWINPASFRPHPDALAPVADLIPELGTAVHDYLA